MPYTLTLVDLRNYLRDLKEEDEVGVCLHAEDCWGARTLNTKYPEHKWATTNSILYTLCGEYWGHVEDGRVKQVLDLFDALAELGDSATKQQVREAGIIAWLEGEDPV